MKFDADRHVNRRAWLADCTRYGLLGGVTAAAGILVCRGQVGGCSPSALACGVCQELAQCELSPAAEAREQLARRERR
ncbi:MAG: hypothetical protein ACYC3X_00930 [Pirellulaceae bacterium]